MVSLGAWPLPGRQTQPGLYLAHAFGDPLKDFFQRFGLFSEEEFLAPQACVELREEMATARARAATASLRQVVRQETISTDV